MHFDLGPELTLPIATRKKLLGIVSLRYFWETGARSTLEGNNFTLDFPIPSISLGQGRTKSAVGALAGGRWRSVP